jgi:hypothetical protein
VDQIKQLEDEVRKVRAVACVIPASGDTDAAAYQAASKKFLDSRVQALVRALDARIIDIQARVKSDLSDDEINVLVTRYQQREKELLADNCTDSGTSGPVAPPGVASPSISPTEHVTISPTKIDFGDTEVRTPKDPQAIRITAATDFTVTGLSYRIPQPDPGERCYDKLYGNRLAPAFREAASDTPCASNLPSQNCTIKVQFSPCKSGYAHGQVIVSGYVVNRKTNQSTIFQNTVDLEGRGYVDNVAHVLGGQTNTPNTRALVGFDVSGATSADTTEKLFVEFNLNAPFIKAGHNDPLAAPVWLFANPRVSSAPQAASALSGFDVQGAFLNTALQKETTTQIVQALDLLSGVEVHLPRLGNPRNGIPFWSEFKNTHARLATSFTVTLGAITPFSSADKTPQEIDLKATPPQNIQDNFPGLVIPTSPAKDTLALVPKQRSRFFRRYYAGFRFKNYYFTDKEEGECDKPKPKECSALYDQFPGIVDIGVGQDESVTGGHLSRWVFRLDGAFAIPYAHGFYAYTTLLTALKKNQSRLPLIAASTTKAITDPSVFITSVDPPNRDSYRVGLGYDLVQLLKLKSTTAQKSQPAPSPSPTF